MVKKLIDQGAVPEYASIQTIVKAVQHIEDNRVLQDYYINSSKKKPQESSYLENQIKREQKYKQNGSVPKAKPIFMNGKPYKVVRYSKDEKSNAGRIQQMSHYANNPKCERYGQLRLYSIQEEVESKPQDHQTTKVVDDQDDVSEAIPVESDSEDESEGRMYDDDDKDMSEFFGYVNDRTNDTEIDSTSLGPEIILEDDLDTTLFPSINLSDFSCCTIEALSPSFVRVANIKVHQLADQHTLQLGTIGSKAKFNYSTITKVAYADIRDNVYFDIVNIDRYDAIIGTQFMHKHGIQLDFDEVKIFIKGQPAPTLSVGEDAAEFLR
ncbi:hypothetical protein EV360DRAFT_76200 [Lentinula raphanica]|nr:hypothetical protein EV360DRAFT_76200 [Lentinula raphanica]